MYVSLFSLREMVDVWSFRFPSSSISTTAEVYGVFSDTFRIFCIMFTFAF